MSKRRYYCPKCKKIVRVVNEDCYGILPSLVRCECCDNNKGLRKLSRFELKVYRFMKWYEEKDKNESFVKKHLPHQEEKKED